MKENLEKILGGFFVFCLTGALFNLPLTEIGLILASALLAMFYYVMGFFILNDLSIRTLMKEKRIPNLPVPLLFGSILAGWDFSILILGILFKVLFFPGADIMLRAGIILLALLQVGAIFIRKKYPSQLKRFYNRIILFFTLGFMAAMVNTDKLVELRYAGSSPEFKKALKYSVKNPSDTAAANKVRIMRMEEAN